MQLHTFDSQIFRQRRDRLAERLRAHGGGTLVLATAAEFMRNRDADYPYRPDSHFWYLCGFTEPEAWLVLQVPMDEPVRSVLFCRDKDPEREIWDGFRHGPAAACEQFGFDEAHAVAKLDELLPPLLRHSPTVFCALLDPTLPVRWQSWLQALARQSRAGEARPWRLIDAHREIDALRLIKQDDEIALMQRAADIAAAGHLRAMRACRPGSAEYALEAELLYAFRHAGAQAPAYGSIVAAGANSCILHYRAGNTRCRDGDIVLIDAGCEFDGYASDITRSFPANGRFSAAQRTLYDIVLAAQAAAIAAISPAHRWNDAHEAALRVLCQGLIDERILEGSVDSVIESGAYKRYYMHRTGHWLGMDVHDVGDYRRDAEPEDSTNERPWVNLEAGMTLTVEPGLYCRPNDQLPEAFWNIGIRIEDDVLVTQDGARVLSAAAPKTPQAIEETMRAAAS